jgi:hypothetical protein
VGNLAQEKPYAYDSFSFNVSKTLQTTELTSPKTTILTMLQFVISLNTCPFQRTLSYLNFFRNSFCQLRKSRNCYWPVESNFIVGVVKSLVAVKVLLASPPPRLTLQKETTSMGAASFTVRASRARFDHYNIPI